MANPNFFTISQSIISNLETEWRDLISRYCSDEATVGQTFQHLIEKYSEKHRAYHNLSHINYLLKEARKIEFADFDSVYLTTWFHDVIYNPLSGDNEIESAKLAVICLQDLEIPFEKIKRTEQIILATQKHSAENLDDDGRIFLDLDLSILGADAEIYLHYSLAIRQEYRHVPNFLYRRGRKKILENFLRRDTIYFTENLRERFEKQARLNLVNEIKALS